MRLRHCSLLLAVVSCADAEEPARVQLPVIVNGGGVTPVQTDLGYEVTLTEVRMAIDNLEFMVGGETHAASLWQRCSSWLLPAAHAHPGHYEGGDVTGELRGHFIVDLLGGGGPMGMATLIVGSYTSSNFTFGIATPSDGSSAEDALVGHTALFVGRASKAGIFTDFTFAVDSFPDRQLVGARFEAEVAASSAFAVRFELMTRDPLEDDTLFDGIPFSELPLDASGNVAISAASTDTASIDAYDTLRRTFQTHDHFRLVAAPE
jgi:hypothetical protein